MTLNIVGPKYLIIWRSLSFHLGTDMDTRGLSLATWFCWILWLVFMSSVKWLIQIYTLNTKKHCIVLQNSNKIQCNAVSVNSKWYQVLLQMFRGMDTGRKGIGPTLTFNVHFRQWTIVSSVIVWTNKKMFMPRCLFYWNLSSILIYLYWLIIMIHTQAVGFWQA